MSYRDSPARVLECFVVRQVGLGAWPFRDGENDPFWKFGTTPRDYQWRIDVEITPQRHSGYRTRVPHVFNGMDVRVGDYIASSSDGLAVRIVSVESKSDSLVTCVVEDEFRYNTFRDPSGMGNGMMTVPSRAIIFSVNVNGLPLVDPLPPSVVDSQFYPNLMSRFQTAESDAHFLVNAPGHGFAEGQVVSTSALSNGFVLTTDANPLMAGRVTNVASEDAFFVSLSQKVLDDLDFLPGEVGDIIYADAESESGLTLSPNRAPVMVKLRHQSQTVTTGTIPATAAVSGSTLSLNGVIATISGSSRLSVVNSINVHSETTGVTASVAPMPVTATTQSSNLSTVFGEALLDLNSVYTVASLNGTVVIFTTTEDGNRRYGTAYATATDMAHDINLAMNGDLVATATGNMLTITNPTGGGIVIQNLGPDSLGHNFSGPNSSSGLNSVTAANSPNRVRLTAVDARAIDIADVTGSTLADFGLVSVENGTKAAAVFIDGGGNGAEAGSGKTDVSVTEGTPASTLTVIGTVTRLTLIILAPFSDTLTIRCGNVVLMEAITYDAETIGIYEVLLAQDINGPIVADTTGVGSGSAKLIAEYLAT